LRPSTGRLTLLGVEVDPLTIPELNARIAGAVVRGERLVVGGHNSHSVYLYHRDPAMRDFHARADVVRIDGMPLLLFARLLGCRLRREQRVTYMDWLNPLLNEARKGGWRLFYLGGKPGVAESAAGMLRAEFPGLIVEARHGYIGSSERENQVALDQINSFGAHVLMVGMGMPRQEHWILANLERVQANAILAVGACFDYVAGAIPTPPRWMGRTGLEWLYRLLSEPGRLWRRYLVEPWCLLPLAVKDLFERASKH
jgi:N-acetylglucosaminyldiphosphoundecaprenol N-acetyl-beta-D-mannosaminyltransferase